MLISDSTSEPDISDMTTSVRLSGSKPFAKLTIALLVLIAIAAWAPSSTEASPARRRPYYRGGKERTYCPSGYKRTMSGRCVKRGQIVKREAGDMGVSVSMEESNEELPVVQFRGSASSSWHRSLTPNSEAAARLFPKYGRMEPVDSNHV